jgi:drug/metabolite transporter (DMT)-like permease
MPTIQAIKSNTSMKRHLVKWYCLFLVLSIVLGALSAILPPFHSSDFVDSLFKSPPFVKIVCLFLACIAAGISTVTASKILDDHPIPAVIGTSFFIAVCINLFSIVLIVAGRQP